jgi:mono/diheme cytochrome c family protein
MRLAADRKSKAYDQQGGVATAWQMVPPPLYLEGIKVQTPWLYKFLKNPDRIRHETVLRMPRFNLDDAEARALANYFSAVDDSEFPYQNIPQREPAYLDRKNQTLANGDSDYLSESWKLLNANVCIGCHSVGGKPFATGPDPKKVTQGPDLNRVHERLRPDWLALWLSKPSWVTPYTKMLNPKEEPSLLRGNRPIQTEALRDALINYPLLLERDGAIFYDPKTQTVKPASEAEAAPTK